MTEEDKEIKKKKIEQNRIKRKLKVPSDEINPKKIKEECSPSSTTQDQDTQISHAEDKSELSSDSSVVEIITAIMEVPNEASQIIQKVMKTQSDALSLMSRIIRGKNRS